MIWDSTWSYYVNMIWNVMKYVFLYIFEYILHGPNKKLKCWIQGYKNLKQTRLISLRRWGVFIHVKTLLARQIFFYFLFFIYFIRFHHRYSSRWYTITHLQFYGHLVHPGLINYKDTITKCCHVKNWPVKGGCLLEFMDWTGQSVMMVFSIQFCELLSL